METSQSPRMVLKLAFRLGQRVLADHSSKFSSSDFTLPQLFACLVLRDFYGLSYRRTEQLLRDSPQWLADIGLSVAPDHNTLWRALGTIVASRPFNRMIDRLAASFVQARLLRLSDKPLALDSTCFEQRHRSVHYDRRCRQMVLKASSAKPAEKPGKWGKSVNRSRSRRLSAMPKLSIAVASACHLILAAKVRIGNGSDAPDFDPLLYHSWRRASVRVAVADAGYDSEPNHPGAPGQDMGVRSIIPPEVGRPTDKLPAGRWRRHMARRFARKADQAHYAQRSQSETVHSMIKRNQGSALRSRTPERRKKECHGAHQNRPSRGAFKTGQCCDASYTSDRPLISTSSQSVHSQFSSRQRSGAGGSEPLLERESEPLTAGPQGRPSALLSLATCATCGEPIQS